MEILSGLSCMLLQAELSLPTTLYCMYVWFYRIVECNFLPFPSLLQVPFLPWTEAEERFRVWLGDKTPCLLLAHNCLSFDGRVLSRMASNELLSLVSGFSDSLPAFRELLLERKGQYSVKALQEHLSPDLEFIAHDAAGDVQGLAIVITKSTMSVTLISKHSGTLSSYSDLLHHRSESRKRAATFDSIVRAKAMSKGMAQKVAESDLVLQQLHLCFARGSEGLKSLLCEVCNGSK